MIYRWETQDSIKAINREIAKHYGIESQVFKSIEECGELIVALAHGDKNNLIEELADVKDMIYQLEKLLNIEAQVEEAQKKKTIRQITRVFREKKQKGDCQW